MKLDTAQPGGWKSVWQAFFLSMSDAITSMAVSVLLILPP